MENYKITVDGDLVPDTNKSNPKTTKQDIFNSLDAAIKGGNATDKDIKLHQQMKKKFGFKKATENLNDKMDSMEKDKQIAAMKMAMAKQNG